jgi:hypothetical protein
VVADGVIGFVRETLSGLAVVREDLEALGVRVKAAAQAAVHIQQWPWQENPALIREEGTEPRRVQLECEKRFDPVAIRFLSTSRKRAAFERIGLNDFSDSAIERAFTHKR